jgi:hypothetical protein
MKEMLAAFRDSMTQPASSGPSAWARGAPDTGTNATESAKSSPEPRKDVEEREVAGLRLSPSEETGRADVIAVDHAESLESGKELASSHAFAMTLGHLDDIRWRVTAMERRPSPPADQAPTEAEAIRRVIRDNFGAFELCYDAGLRHDPLLHGRVVVRLDIASGGAVALAADGGSDLPDPDVVACVVRAFGGLSFAPSDAPAIHVVYPLVFFPKS